MVYRSKEETLEMLLGGFAVDSREIVAGVLWERLRAAQLVRQSPDDAGVYAVADVLRLRTEVLCSIIGAVAEDIRHAASMTIGDLICHVRTLPGVPGQAGAAPGGGFVWRDLGTPGGGLSCSVAPNLPHCKSKVRDTVHTRGAAAFLGVWALPSLTVSVRSLAQAQELTEEPATDIQPERRYLPDPVPAHLGASPELLHTLARWLYRSPCDDFQL